MFKVGLVVKFVPFSEMLRWENSFVQDSFRVLPINEDTSFLSPSLQLAPCAEIRSPFISPTSSGAVAVRTPEQQKEPIALPYSVSRGQRDLQLNP